MIKGVLTKRFLLGLAAASAVGGAVVGGAFVGRMPEAQAADYSPPSLVDAQTFLLQKGTRRSRNPDGGASFTCHALCRSAEAGGVRPRGCALAPAMDAGTFAAADVECLQEAVAGCTPQAVHECANPVTLN
jgi:hypothetical protein